MGAAPKRIAVISLLRGVNVGPHKRMSMDALRALYLELGFEDPQTYVQSGNVLFRITGRGPANLADRIEQAIETRFGFHSHVILRTRQEMAETVAHNPFANRPEIEANRLIVTFFRSDPGEEGRAKLRSLQVDREEISVVRRELYAYFPDGMGRTKLTPARVERAAGTPGTARNWNSVTKMLAIATEIERD